MDPKLIAVLIGQPRALGRPGAEDPLERPWRSAIFKAPVEGPILLTREGLAGDACENRAAHGGPEQAVCVCVADHLTRWNEEFPGHGFAPGAFGENFCVTGLSEQTVAIGDIFVIGSEIGEARVQVAKPRMPCPNLARRGKINEQPARLLATSRMGWYLRVLGEGLVEAGQTMRHVERPHSEWTVERVAQIYLNRSKDRQSAAALAEVPALAEDWRRELAT